MTQPVCDVTVPGLAFAAAVGQILPRSPKKDLGGIVLSSAGLGILRLTSFFASADLPVEGEWGASVAVSGRFLLGVMVRKPPAVVHLIYADATLMMNGTSVTASVASDDTDARKPDYVRIKKPARRRN